MEVRGDRADQSGDDAVILLVQTLLSGLHVLSPLLQRRKPFSPGPRSRRRRSIRRSGFETFPKEGEAEVPNARDIVTRPRSLLLVALEEFLDLSWRIEQLDRVEASWARRVVDAF